MSAKTDRIDLRLASETKTFLVEAATLLGVNVTQFVVDAALQSAQQVREEHQQRVFSNRDRATFLSILDNAEPNAVLKQAFDDVRAQRG